MFKPDNVLTADNASAVLQDGLRAIAGGQTDIDLSQVATVDSSAVATLLAWRRAAVEQGRPLDFGTLPANLQSLADLYGVGSLLQGNSTSAPTSATDRHH